METRKRQMREAHARLYLSPKYDNRNEKELCMLAHNKAVELTIKAKDDFYCHEVKKPFIYAN